MTPTEDLIGKVFGNSTNSSEEEEAEEEQHISSDVGRGNGNGKDRKKSSRGEKNKGTQAQQQYTTYKYSNRGKGSLHESIILAGLPVFLKYENGEVKTVEHVEEPTRIIKSPHSEHYPYEPYEFESMNEVLNYVERARKESIDSLYLQAKQIAADYNDQKKDKVNLLAIEIISSYFQDRFPTTHYDIVLGGNGSGKSSYGDTFTAVGYRVVNLTDPNAANINRILGVIEIGQCTIVSDETGAINKHPELMSLLKTGYSARGKTSKINDNSRNPEFFYTYCFKMIISERMPNLSDARGVVDRSFTFTTYKGRPKYDIKETLEPQGNPARQERLDALNDFRKLMLIYRLLHFKDPISDVNVGMGGREKELSKPIIQLFYGSKVQKEVETTLQNFLNLRAEKKEITLEPILHPIVARLVSEEGNEIYVKRIWEEIKVTIEGYSDEKKPYEHQTLEYGTIYNNSISNILEHTFGGRPKHREHGNTFIFDVEELSRVGKAYNLPTKIQTKIIVKEEEGCYYGDSPEDPEGSEGSTAKDSNCTDNVPTENSGMTTNSSEKLFQNEQNDRRADADFKQEETDNTTAYPVKPSGPSEPSASVKSESTTIVSVEEFFNDVADLPYQPLPEHSLEQSPCYPIIGKNQELYFCRLHSEVKNVNLDPIEHHCKYKDPDYHKSEILKLLSTKSPTRLEE
jgi:hypothetical protein